MITKYARGMVYWVNLPNTYGDSVQTGRRPCVIVSNNIGNIFSDNITIVPCTTNIEKATNQPTHYTTKVYVTTESVVLCENIVTISKKLCDSFIGLLDENEMKAIDECIAIALGLKEIPKHTKPKDIQEEHHIQEEPIQEKTINQKITDPEVKKQFILDFEKYGVEYIVKKYHVASVSAAYHRKEYYQKQLTNLK